MTEFSKVFSVVGCVALAAVGVLNAVGDTVDKRIKARESATSAIAVQQLKSKLPIYGEFSSQAVNNQTTRKSVKIGG